MAREWALAGVSEEELKPDVPLAPPKTPKGKWQNFWYHHKWKVVAVAFVALVVGVCTWQMVTRDEPDYRLVLVTKSYVSSDTAELLGTLIEPYGEDLDEDGKVEVLVEPLYLESTSLDRTTTDANAQKFTAYLAAGDVMFFAMDPTYYEERIKPLLSDEYQFFAPLTVSTELEDEGRQWNWKNSTLRENAVLRDALPEDLWFGVRVADGMVSGEKSRQISWDSFDLLTKLIKGTATEP